MPSRVESSKVGFIGAGVRTEATPGEGPAAWHPEGGVWNWPNWRSQTVGM